MATDSVRSVVFQAPYRIELAESPLPQLQPGQLLVETIVTAISPGTEMLFYRGEAPTELELDATIPSLAGAMDYPLQYGYANVGRVVEIGEGSDSSWLGRLVFAFHPHQSHFATIPEHVLPLPEGCTPERAALLPNMETAVSLVMDGEPRIGEVVAVFGQGIVGLLTTALLARFPLERLYAVDRYEHRLSRAQAVGATDVLAPHELASEAGIEADLVFELTGNPEVLNQAIESAGYAGRIVVGSWYGRKRAHLNLGGRFHRSRIRIISSQVSTIAPHYSGRWDKDRRLRLAWSMLALLDVESLITHRLPVADAAHAYSLIDQHPEQTIQVLLTYSQNQP